MFRKSANILSLLARLSVFDFSVSIDCLASTPFSHDEIHKPADRTFLRSKIVETCRRPHPRSILASWKRLRITAHCILAGLSSYRIASLLSSCLSASPDFSFLASTASPKLARPASSGPKIRIRSVMNSQRGTRSWTERTSIRSYTSLTKRPAPEREHDDVADDEDLHHTHSCTNSSNNTTDGSLVQQIQTPHSSAVDPVHWLGTAGCSNTPAWTRRTNDIVRSDLSEICPKTLGS
jgi:hypothetical protein